MAAKVNLKVKRARELSLRQIKENYRLKGRTLNCQRPTKASLKNLWTKKPKCSR